eukprot:Opistho-2@4867
MRPNVSPLAGIHRKCVRVVVLIAGLVGVALATQPQHAIVHAAAVSATTADIGIQPSGSFFTEALALRAVGRGFYAAHFRFTNDWEVASESLGHYTLFPKSIGSIFVAHPTLRRLSLSFARGRWREEQWGLPWAHTNPAGAVLWASFAGGDNSTGDSAMNTEDCDGRFRLLTSAIAGVFCSGLNAADASRTAATEWNVPWGTVGKDETIRRVSLPHDLVCTENLTPWLKQLPCREESGLASLLNPRRLFASSFFSMSVDVERKCKDAHCKAFSMNAVQTLDAVLAPSGTSPNGLLESLFDRSVVQSCPVALSSSVDITSISPEGAFGLGHVVSHSHDLMERFSSQSGFFDVSVASLPPSSAATPSPFVARKYLARAPSPSASGASALFGRLWYELGNNAAGSRVAAVLSDVIPWQLRPYAHTLQVHVTDGTAEGASFRTLGRSEYAVRLVPSVERGRPFVLELRIYSLPSSPSTCVVSLDYEVAMLRMSEHPPDAHRGFDIGAATVTFEVAYSASPSDMVTCAKTNRTHLPVTLWDMRSKTAADPCDVLTVRLHTESPLLTPPTPDFSMPYNVLCLTCIVMALSVGSFFNLATRTFRRTKIPPSLRTRLAQRFRWRNASIAGDDGTGQVQRQQTTTSSLSLAQSSTQS